MAFYFLGDGVVNVPVWFDDEADYAAALVQNRFNSLVDIDVSIPQIADIALDPEQIQPSFEEAWPQPVWLTSYDVASGQDAWNSFQDNLSPVTLTATPTDNSSTLNATLTAPLTFNASLSDSASTLIASSNIAVSLAANVIDAASTLAATATISVSISGNVIDAASTLVASLTAPIGLNANLPEGNTTLSAVANIGSVFTLNASLTDAASSLAASLTQPFFMTFNGLDAADTLTAFTVIPVSLNGAVTDATSTLSSTLALPLAVNGTLADNATTLNAALSGLPTLNLNATLLDDADFISSTITIADTPPVQQQPFDFNDGWSRAADKFRKKQKDDDRDLAEIVEKAFAKVTGEEIPTIAEKKQIVKIVRADAGEEGIPASITKINMMISALALELDRQESDDEEQDIIMMLLNL
jgi:hypothetical protein